MFASRWLRDSALVLLISAGTVMPSLGQVRRPVGAPPPAPPPAAPLGAKVGETLMGPRTKRMVISEDGNHMAIVTAKGSRQVVLIDGVEGPVFDEIPETYVWTSWPGSPGPVVLSPTGGHSAYVGRRAGDFIAVVDGKEAVTLSTPATQQGIGYSDPKGWNFYFNHDGSHLAYAAIAGPASWVMVLDGVKGTPYHAFDLTQIALNGKHLIYVAQVTFDMKWHAVVDGKAGPGYDTISGLKVTSDGTHYAFLATRRGTGPGAAGATGGLAVIDGVEGPVYPMGVSDLEQAPDGRVSYMAMKPQTSPGGNPPHLIVGTLDIPNTTTFGVTIRNASRFSPQYHVAWSPDGKRFACVQTNTPNPGITVLVNGKPMGLTYDNANELVWSPDGSRFAYQARSKTGTFLVLDGQELAGYNWIKEFQFSPSGKRYAFYAANSTGIWMNVDGKEQPKALGITTDALRFSPVGDHIAYGAQSTVITYQPIVDGVAKPYNLGNFASKNQTNPQTLLPVFFYSPDGNHLAYVAGKADGSGKVSVWVDDVANPGPLPSYFNPAWSPDSRHFAAIVSNGSGQGWTIMIDGKLSQPYEDFILLNEASSGFADAHTFRFYATKGTDVYRVTLDIGG